MQHIHILNSLLGRFDVHADHVVVPAGKLKKRFSHFAQTNNNNFLSFLHVLGPPELTISLRKLTGERLRVSICRVLTFAGLKHVDVLPP